MLVSIDKHHIKMFWEHFENLIIVFIFSYTVESPGWFFNSRDAWVPLWTINLDFLESGTWTFLFWGEDLCLLHCILTTYCSQGTKFIQWSYSHSSELQETLHLGVCSKNALRVYCVTANLQHQLERDLIPSWSLYILVLAKGYLLSLFKVWI